jgi:hypothetical protein
MSSLILIRCNEQIKNYPGLVSDHHGGRAVYVINVALPCLGYLWILPGTLPRKIRPLYVKVGLQSNMLA